MLVLTRKADESITIGSEITVTVLRIHKGSVSLGITAPREIPVHRQEIFQKLQKKE